MCLLASGELPPDCVPPFDWGPTQRLYSQSGKTSYNQISRSLEAARLGVIAIVSLWNLTGITAALLPNCLSNFRAIGKVLIRITRLRDFTRSCCDAVYRLVNRGPGQNVPHCADAIFERHFLTDRYFIWFQFSQVTDSRIALKKKRDLDCFTGDIMYERNHVKWSVRSHNVSSFLRQWNSVLHECSVLSVIFYSKRKWPKDL